MFEPLGLERLLGIRQRDITALTGNPKFTRFDQWLANALRTDIARREVDTDTLVLLLALDLDFPTRPNHTPDEYPPTPLQTWIHNAPQRLHGTRSGRDLRPYSTLLSRANWRTIAWGNALRVYSEFCIDFRQSGSEALPIILPKGRPGSLTQWWHRRQENKAASHPILEVLAKFNTLAPVVAATLDIPEALYEAEWPGAPCPDVRINAFSIEARKTIPLCGPEVRAYIKSLELQHKQKEKQC